MFDITKYEIADSAEYPVTDANGNDLFIDDAQTIPATITVLSPGSKVASKAKFTLDKARQSRVFAEMGGKKNTRTEEDDLKERASFLATIAPSMNFQYVGGAVALYSNAKLGHIADGVEAFFGKRGNFSVDLPTASSSTSDTLPG